MTELKDLSPEQQRVVLSWGQGMAVLAGAGSGKTTTLVIKCVELLKRDPEARFAAVSFTERSASDLRLKLTQRLGALSRHWVMTIHGLCATIIREYPREAGYDGEESMLSEGEASLLWERALDTIWMEDELPSEVSAALDLILARETRSSLMGLLVRVRELSSFGALEELGRSSDPSARALGQVGGFVLDRYTRLKRRRGALDFNDLERGADRALESPAVREALRRRFDLVLVDEFQDTNPLQARIVMRLVNPDLSNLCVVGDPKQSIYRFRDADVAVFEEFCSRLPLNYKLTWNFRSRPGIIEYANTVCEPAFHASEMRFDPLVPKREVRTDLEAVLRLDVSQERGPAELAAWIKSQVERGVRLDEVALLLRRIRGNERWLKALTSAGLPIAVGSGGLFWSDPRVRELGAFLKWWDNPGNSLSGVVFMRAPWMNMPGVQMDALIDEWIKKDPTLVEPFFASSHPVAQALKPLRTRVVRPGELLMALLEGDETGAMEAELGAPLLGLWHRVEDLSWRGLGMSAVVADVSRGIEEQRRDRDVPPPKNQGQLSVLTLHGSKGLEFPHVILLDFGKKGRAGESPLLFWDRQRGAYLGKRDEEGERDRKDSEEVSWREIEKSKNLAESKRLFYVALTRAQERLILVCPELPELGDSKKSEDPSPEGQVFREDFWRGWIDEVQGDVLREDLKTQETQLTGALISNRPRVSDVPSSSTAAISRFSKSSPKIAQRRPRHSVTEWNLLSRCERAYEWTYIRPVALADGAEEIGLFTGTKVATREQEELSQRELGTAVHACLEKGDFDGLKALEKQVGPERFLAEPVISWAMSSEWMAPPSPGREVWAELAFEAPFGREILVGSLDRLVAENTSAKAARYTIVDFKITEKPKSVEALLDSYQMQMDLYAWGLQALDPRIERERIEALLINISAKTIQAFPVPLGQLKIQDLPVRAAEIVAGRDGKPTPSSLCRYCDFRPQCPEGRKSI